MIDDGGAERTGAAAHVDPSSVGRDAEPREEPGRHPTTPATHVPLVRVATLPGIGEKIVSHGQRRPSARGWGDLTSRGSVEDDPHGEVLGEILAPVFRSGGDEDEVAGLERISAAVVKEDAPAARDDVDFVLFVGGLTVGGHG